MSIHKNLRALTIRQLSLSGQGVPATLNKYSDGVYDPSTGFVEGAGETAYVGSGLRVNYSTYDYRDATIVHGDFRLYLCPVLQDKTDCPTPSIGDTVEFDNDLYVIINMQFWKAGNLDCGWKLQLRKG